FPYPGPARTNVAFPSRAEASRSMRRGRAIWRGPAVGGRSLAPSKGTNSPAMSPRVRSRAPALPIRRRALAGSDIMRDAAETSRCPRLAARGPSGGGLERPVLPAGPRANRRGPQDAVRRARPASPEQHGSNRVLLGRIDDPRFVEGMGVCFARREKARAEDGG